MYKRTMTRRFYVGTSCLDEDARFLKTLGEATELAKRLVTESGCTRYIVEVVRLVEPADCPIRVIDIRR